MSALHSTMVKQRPIEGLRGAEHRLRQPTNGRQGKRPALGAAYVVGWIGQFTDTGDMPRWRSWQFAQGNQCPERRRTADRAGIRL